MKPGLFHHVEIYVSNLSESKKFWSWFLCENFGYEQYQKWDKGVSYKFNDTYIVFVQVENRFSDITFHRCRVGLNHLAFYGKSKEHIDQLTSELRSKGVKILYEDRHPHAGNSNSYSVFFEDPDRIKVEVVYSENK